MALASVFVACLLNPYLLARLAAPRAGAPMLAAIAFAVGAAINIAVPTALHLGALPIDEATLRSSHALVGLALLTAMLLMRRPLLPPASTPDECLAFLPAVSFAVLFLPFAHLGDPDACAWQDLATSVRVEGSIPWFLHAVSLLGFGPRAHSSAQPLILASLQIMGRVGVDWGYYLLSIFSAFGGTMAAYVLARRCFSSRRAAAWMALLYAFSPTFVRYNHWATGRGLFLSLFPLFLLAVLDLPRARAFFAAAATALLLALCHKTALIAVPLVAFSALLSPLMPRRLNRALRLALCVPPLLLSLALVHPLGPFPLGAALGVVRTALNRFACIVPLVAGSILLAGSNAIPLEQRRLMFAGWLAFPLGFLRDWYGALMALPFLTLAAVNPVALGSPAPWLLRRWIPLLAALLTVASPLVVITRHALQGATTSVIDAARFLEAHDPTGPYQVSAPGPARSQIQAYVSGCPRFVARAAPSARLALQRPPSLSGDLRTVAQSWIDYLRESIALSDSHVAWYGDGPRHYYVVLNGDGEHPDGARLIFSQGETLIFEADETP